MEPYVWETFGVNSTKLPDYYNWYEANKDKLGNPATKNSKREESDRDPTNSSYTTKDTEVETFKRGQKRHKKNYPQLKDEAFWPIFQRKLRIQLKADGLEKVLDVNYKPQTDAEKELDKWQNNFFFSVLEYALLTDHGKSIVREYEEKEKETGVYDGRAAYAALVKVMTQSSKGLQAEDKLVNVLVTSR